MNTDTSAAAIRPATATDLDALLGLLRQLHRADSPSPQRAEVERTWAAMLADPRMRIFVGEEAGTLVTSCTLVVLPNLTRACRPWAVVENVVTRADCRRRGYGRAVLARALAAAWALGCYKVMVLAGAAPAQRRFYEAAGFDGDRKHGFVVYSSTPPIPSGTLACRPVRGVA